MQHFSKYNHTSPCQNCRIRGAENFVYDTRRAELCCLNCAVVQSKIFSQYLYGSVHSYTNPVHTVRSTSSDVHPQERARQKKDMEAQAKLYHRMTQRFCKEENAVDKREKQIDQFAEYLGWSDSGLNGHQSHVTIKCKGYFIRNEELRTRRPKKETIAATLIVAKRSCGHYVDVADISERLDLGDLGGHVIAVCKILGLSQRSSIESQIPGFVMNLGFPFKYKKHVEKLYNRYSIENGAMASNTVMALILHRFYFANKKKSNTGKFEVTIDYIARLTGTSVTTLNTYIQNGNCTVYPKRKPTNKRKRPVVENTNNNNNKKTKTN